jgi:hypothetical protein
MTDEIQVSSSTGTVFSSRVKVRVAQAASKVRVLGLPGPDGKPGPQGPQGIPGASASLSSDANNTAQLGSDGGIYVPPPQLASAQW